MSQSGIELSGYDFVPLRESGEFTLYRGWQGGNPSPILVVAPAAEHPSPQSLRRLEHEYSLAAEVDPLWAAKPLALSRYEGRTAPHTERPRAAIVSEQARLAHARILTLKTRPKPL